VRRLLVAQSLTTGTVAATSGFNEVIEFGSFLSQFASLLLATNTSL
jgi:hypothetical protein